MNKSRFWIILSTLSSCNYDTVTVEMSVGDN